jgi:hypothetical protein
MKQAKLSAEREGWGKFMIILYSVYKAKIRFSHRLHVTGTISHFFLSPSSLYFFPSSKIPLSTI